MLSIRKRERKENETRIELKKVEKEQQSTIAPLRHSSYRCHRFFSLTLLVISFPSLQRAVHSEWNEVRERERERERETERQRDNVYY